VCKCQQQQGAAAVTKMQPSVYHAGSKWAACCWLAALCCACACACGH
jgi:hypothetical protein